MHDCSEVRKISVIIRRWVLKDWCACYTAQLPICPNLAEINGKENHLQLVAVVQDCWWCPKWLSEWPAGQKRYSSHPAQNRELKCWSPRSWSTICGIQKFLSLESPLGWLKNKKRNSECDQTKRECDGTHQETSHVLITKYNSTGMLDEDVIAPGRPPSAQRRN